MQDVPFIVHSHITKARRDGCACRWCHMYGIVGTRRRDAVVSILLRHERALWRFCLFLFDLLTERCSECLYKSSLPVQLHRTTNTQLPASRGVSSRRRRKQRCVRCSAVAGASSARDMCSLRFVFSRTQVTVKRMLRLYVQPDSTLPKERSLHTSSSSAPPLDSYLLS